MSEGQIILVGAGKMGGALLEGWIKQGIKRNRILIIEPDEARALSLKAHYGVSVSGDGATIPVTAVPAIVVLAVKPQHMAATLPAYTRFAEAGAVFVSIAAGKTTDFFRRYLGQNAAIIRTMPNLAAIVGKGATALYATSMVTPSQKQQAAGLFDAVGQCFWLEDEALIDAVTALSGSGPAYLFLLAECMAKAGEALGLSGELSSALAEQTLLGSAELLIQAEEEAGTLRQHVTSPGGTTEAALQVLMGKGGMEPLIAQAMQAACRRSEELAE